MGDLTTHELLGSDVTHSRAPGWTSDSSARPCNATPRMLRTSAGILEDLHLRTISASRSPVTDDALPHAGLFNHEIELVCAQDVLVALLAPPRACHTSTGELDIS